MNRHVCPSGQGSMSSLVTTVDKVKGDTAAQWTERSYWGGLPVGDRYFSSAKEIDDFNKLMAAA
ncbi:hypothetical protein LMG24238_02426 [Paraburkholderia sediminicola]|uniref:Uncharacterized protein n=1 Tax=Paraburkholderia sediminicola TaxID=458836 RepID=A0A6J5APU0_9BURK|nr:hypothetical protein [Paraburkholderia sediminicola]CAB3677212.1 hypothetical protein LMG24238_02426 [Paraburkholderia sediminicola]